MSPGVVRDLMDADDDDDDPTHINLLLSCLYGLDTSMILYDDDANDQTVPGVRTWWLPKILWI